MGWCLEILEVRSHFSNCQVTRQALWEFITFHHPLSLPSVPLSLSPLSLHPKIDKERHSLYCNSCHASGSLSLSRIMVLYIDTQRITCDVTPSKWALRGQIVGRTSKRSTASTLNTPGLLHTYSQPPAKSCNSQ